MSNQVIDWVERLALTRARGFRPISVAKAFNTTVSEAMEQLQPLVAEEKLILWWELLCPGCDRIIERNLGEFSLIGEEVYCDLCEQSFLVEEFHFSPMYMFNPEYKQTLTEKYKERRG